MFQSIFGSVATVWTASGQPSAGIEVGIWKWVIIMGVGAVIVFYTIKRIADFVTDRKTDAMIQQVEEDLDEDDEGRSSR